MSLTDVLTAVSLVRKAVACISNAKSAYDTLNEIQSALDGVERAYNSSSHANTLYSLIRQNSDFLGCLVVLVRDLETKPEVQNNADELLEPLKSFTYMIELFAQTNTDAIEHMRKIVDPNQFTLARIALAGSRLKKLKDKLAEIDAQRTRISQQWPLLARVIEVPGSLPQAQEAIALVWVDDAQARDELPLRETLKSGYRLQKNLAKLIPRLRNVDTRDEWLEATIDSFDTNLNKAKEYVRTGNFPRLKSRIKALNVIINNINRETLANPKIDPLDPEDSSVSLETLDRLDLLVKGQLRKFAAERGPSWAEWLKEVDELLEGETEIIEFDDASPLTRQELALQKQADLDLFVKNVQLAYQESLMAKQTSILRESMRILQTQVVERLQAEENPNSATIQHIEELFRVAEKANFDRFEQTDEFLQQMCEDLTPSKSLASGARRGGK